MQMSSVQMNYNITTVGSAEIIEIASGLEQTSIASTFTTAHKMNTY